MLAQALSSGSEDATALPEPTEKQEKAAACDDDDTLPEDRFHSRDMMSQHIKDERERQRNEKIENIELSRRRKPKKRRRKGWMRKLKRPKILSLKWIQNWATVRLRWIVHRCRPLMLLWN